MKLTCPACGQDSGALIASWDDWIAACGQRADGPMRLAAAEVSGVSAQAPGLWQCASCQSVSMTIAPTGEQLAAFYSNYHATDDFVRKAPKKVARAFKRILPFRLVGGGGRFLEVGASIGTAAEAARRLGFDPVAQEIDAVALSQGQDLYPQVEFIQGFLDDVPKTPAFDMIYAAEVIEHVTHPLDFAKSMLERMAPNGRLFLTTPDAGHPKRPEPFMSWGSVKPPEHITLFTKSGLREMMTKAGFDRIRFYPYAKPGIRMSARRPR